MRLFDYETPEKRTQSDEIASNRRTCFSDRIWSTLMGVHVDLGGLFKTLLELKEGPQLKEQKLKRQGRACQGGLQMQYMTMKTMVRLRIGMSKRFRRGIERNMGNLEEDFVKSTGTTECIRKLTNLLTKSFHAQQEAPSFSELISFSNLSMKLGQSFYQDSTLCRQ